MKAELKAQDCTDHDPIEAWQPPDADDVDYRLCLHIGPAGQSGEELFYVNVLSDAAARRIPAARLARRKHIIVSDYSWSGVMRAVNEALREAEGADWSEVAQKLARRFDWEFERYQPYVPRNA